MCARLVIVATAVAAVGWIPSPPALADTALPTGTVATVAGNGTQGYSGDGGPATAASTDTVAGVAVDQAGNVYFTTRYGCVVRRVDPSGRISTVVGGSTCNLSGDGGPASSAGLYGVSGIAVDVSGNLYLADHVEIRKVDLAGTITKVAAVSGTGGITVDSSGNIFFTSGDQVKRSTPSGTVTTVAGSGTRGFSGDGGPATAAALNGPYGLVIDSNGRLFIADTCNNRVRAVDQSGVI